MKATAVECSILYNKHKLRIEYKRMSNRASYHLCTDLDLRKSPCSLRPSHYFSKVGFFFIFLIAYPSVATVLLQGYLG